MTACMYVWSMAYSWQPTIFQLVLSQSHLAIFFLATCKAFLFVSTSKSAFCDFFCYVFCFCVILCLWFLAKDLVGFFSNILLGYWLHSWYISDWVGGWNVDQRCGVQGKCTELLHKYLVKEKNIFAQLISTKYLTLIAPKQGEIVKNGLMRIL